MLIVEDEPLVRNMVVRILFEQGYRVLEAANGEEALRVVNSHAGENIHLLLTDLVMPQMGGKDLAERLKTLRHHQGAAHVRISQRLNLSEW